MLKKRLIGVITVKDGLAVQSNGYKRYLPLGTPEILAENLDRWGADEILLQCIDRSTKKLGPEFALLERVGKMGLGTPLIYGGGIRTVDEGIQAIKLGADRICVDALLRDTPDVVGELSRKLGAQALIASLPLSIEKGALHLLDYRLRESKPLDDMTLRLLQDQVVSELLVIDWKNEGKSLGFDLQLLAQFPLLNIPIIAFGGLSEATQLRYVLGLSQVVAVAVGNFLNYREHAISHLKEQLVGLPLRMPTSKLVST